MRVLVTGGRDFANRELLYDSLDKLLRYAFKKGVCMTVIEGGARGADRLAQEWAKRYPDNVKLITERADWNNLNHPDAVIRTRPDGSKYDSKAGHRRNQKMLDDHRPELVLRFPGGSGTADMCRRAHKAGVRIVEIDG